MAAEHGAVAVGSSRGRRGCGHRRTGSRYFDICAAVVVFNGVVVSGFGVVAFALYVDLSAGELALFAACSAVAFAVEGVLAAVYLLRDAEPARAWLAGERAGDDAEQAWSAAARLPLALLRHPSLYAIGAVGAVATDLLLASLLDSPHTKRCCVLPASYLVYVSSVVLRYVALELAMRPLLEDIGQGLPEASPPDAARVSLHRRLFHTVPMVAWGRRSSSPGCSPTTRATSTRSRWRASSPSPLPPPSRPGSASCWPTRSRRRSSTFATRHAGSAPAISPCACRSSPPTRLGSSPRHSTRWWPGSASASSCARRSAPSSIRR